MHELPSAMRFAMRPMPPADWVTLRNLVIVVLGSTAAALVIGLSCLGSGPIADGNGKSVRSSAGGVPAASAQTSVTSGELDRGSPASGSPAHRATPPTPTTTPATPVPPPVPPTPATQVLPTVTAPPASGQQAPPSAFVTPLPSNAPPFPAEPLQPSDAHAPPGVMVRGIAAPQVAAEAGRLVAAPPAAGSTPRDEPTPNETPEER